VTSATAKSWIYRYTLRGRERQLGLGSVSAITLKRARELVAEPRRLRAEGIDPVDHRRAERAAAAASAANGVSFRQMAEDYVAAHEHAWRNAAHRQQWRTTLGTYVYPLVGDLPVATIATPHVLAVLRPIWTTRTETAARVRGRIETILDAAKS